jgi:hypothetical protein
MPLGVTLEFLRSQQGINQITKQKDGGDAANQIVHDNSSVSMPGLQAITGFGEEPAKQKK